MAEFFGELERIAADLYPYRWPIAVGLLAAIAVAIAFGYRRGWHMFAWQRRLPFAIFGIPALALVTFISYDLGSPLFTNVTVEEEFPFANTAEVPADMDREDVEQIMAGMAHIDQEFDEAIPDTMMKTGDEMPATSTAVPVISGSPTEPTVGPVMLKTGNFRDQDSFHKGSGQVTIYRGPDGSHLLRLEDFKTTNGPDLHVILTPHQNPGRQNDVKTPGYVDLGKLKGNIGNQNYPIPDDIDVTAQNSVVIYCMPFHVIFSVAQLQDVT
ncbi:MAG: DM13 domain-containing protein [Chloroflexi bacterium]|nr:DM13 domain-containing protein [Chloroflexota bacterium]